VPRRAEYQICRSQVSVPSSVTASASLGAAVHSDCSVGQSVEHFMVNVVETLEVETSLPHLVRTEPLQQLWIPILDAAHEI
jgi:hypothetical protein